MIIIENLVAGYKGIPVLNGISLELSDGNVHGLVGLNGSGKTTLLKCIYGLIKPNSGMILKEGMPLSRKTMIFLETESYFYHGITGREYLSLFKNPDSGEFNLMEWSDLFHIPVDKLIDHYSTGMKKKLALLGMIRTGKQLMLLDEPFNGLDIESARVLQAVITRLREKGRTILLTSHILGTLTEHCDQIHHLHDGTIMKSYKSDEAGLLESELFREFDERISGKIDKLL